MSGIAVPIVGGMASSTMLTLVVIPAVHALIKGNGLAFKVQRPVNAITVQSQKL